MMTASAFLQDLTVVLTTAAAVIFLFRKLGQPPVLGYLAAGLLIGPYTPLRMFVSDVLSLEALAQIGVIFLLFALGIEFNLDRLSKIGIRALICALIEAAMLVPLGYLVGRWLGWRPMESLLLGGIVALASTALVARTLLERSRSPSGWEALASGTLIAEDMIAVLLVAFFSSAPASDGLSLAGLWPSMVRLTVLVTFVLIIGLLAFPRLFAALERFGVAEIRTLMIIGICFGISLITEKLGFSAALGAFLAGATVATGGSAGRLDQVVTPFKDLFGAVFFVSVGMLIDPAWVLSHWQITCALGLAVIAARAYANFIAFLAVGETKSSSAQAALARLPIGEFSFILAQVGQAQGVSDKPVYPLAVTLCLFTTTASSFLFPRSLKPGGLAWIFPGFNGAWLSRYQRRVKDLALPERQALVWRLIRPSLLQILINGLIITGLFFAAPAVERRYAWSLDIPGASWLAAAMLSLPFLLALFRKTHAVMLVILEAAISQPGRDPVGLNPFWARLALGFSMLVVGAWYLSLSADLLPGWPHAALPVSLLAIAVLLLWRYMNRLYSRIQVALRDGLARKHVEPEAATKALLHFVSALTPESVHINSIVLEPGCWAQGRSIREIELRSKSGASILQISRGGEMLPAPGPELRLHEGDKLLLIGEDEQIEKARAVLFTGGL
ncbi:MAG: cation:proton antiporter [Elusimicrobia bacterium]|nr:cation:proton antiporter [Elusimicrobiota bacterium]